MHKIDKTRFRNEIIIPICIRIVSAGTKRFECTWRMHMQPGELLSLLPSRRALIQPSSVVSDAIFKTAILQFKTASDSAFISTRAQLRTRPFVIRKFRINYRSCNGNSNRYRIFNCLFDLLMGSLQRLLISICLCI